MGNWKMEPGAARSPVSGRHFVNNEDVFAIFKFFTNVFGVPGPFSHSLSLSLPPFGDDFGSVC